MILSSSSFPSSISCDPSCACFLLPLQAGQKCPVKYFYVVWSDVPLKDSQYLHIFSFWDFLNPASKSWLSLLCVFFNPPSIKGIFFFFIITNTKKPAENPQGAAALQGQYECPWYCCSTSICHSRKCHLAQPNPLYNQSGESTCLERFMGWRLFEWVTSGLGWVGCTFLFNQTSAS